MFKETRFDIRISLWVHPIAWSCLPYIMRLSGNVNRCSLVLAKVVYGQYFLLKIKGHRSSDWHTCKNEVRDVWNIVSVVIFVRFEIRSP